MKKAALATIFIGTISLAIISHVSALDEKDALHVQESRINYNPLMYKATILPENDMYALNDTMSDKRNTADNANEHTVLADDTIMSYIAIQNNPHQIVNSLSYSFSLPRRGARSSFKIDIPSTPGDLVMLGAAFLTNLAVHEVGHEVVAQHVGATGSRLDFFETRNGQFFLGTSSVEDIESNSILPYTMGGEFFADLTFEHALRDYRRNPNMYNQSLLLYSGIDFAFYCFYAFYASEDHPEYDPVTISQETGISRDHLFSIVLAKTMINAYRIYSGEDRVIPYFTVDKHSAMLNLAIPFELPSCAFGNCGLPEEEI